MEPAHARPCRSCGRPRPCGGDCANDRKAREWLKAQVAAGKATSADLAELPHEFGSARILGGNHERIDRGAPVEHMRRHAAKIAESMELRHYLEELETRLRVARRTVALTSVTVAELERDTRILAMHLAGREQADIAAAFERRSHSFASEAIERIVGDMRARTVKPSVAHACGCQRPGCLVVSQASTGRPRRYSPTCARTINSQRTSIRRRMRVSQTLFQTGKAAEPA